MHDGFSLFTSFQDKELVSCPFFTTIIAHVFKHIQSVAIIIIFEVHIVMGQWESL